jgi:hypothetical protein
MSALDVQGNVLGMVPNSLKENTTSKQAELKRRYFDVCSEFVPGVRPDSIRHHCPDDAIQIEKEEKGQYATDQNLDEKDPIEAEGECQRRRI